MTKTNIPIGAEALPFDADRYSDLRTKVEAANKICVLGHIGPDGDAVGSCTGFVGTLRNAYPDKEINIILPNPAPRILDGLYLIDEIYIYDQNHTINVDAEKLILDADLIFCLDFQSPERVGQKLSTVLIDSKAPKILIDHHLYPNLDFFCLSFSFPGSSSTAELVFNLIHAVGWQKYITPEIAKSILCGIITDTGCFSYQSEKSTVFEVAGRLLDYGADKEALIHEIYHRNTMSQVKLKGYVMGEKLTFVPEIGLAYFILTKEEMVRFGVKDDETEGFVNEPLNIEGIHYSFFIRQRDNLLKISFRSQGDYPVNEVATKLFGGGGHKNAAGAEYHDVSNPEIPAKMIIDEFKKIHNK
ncbi:DHH family phosphoesterase [Falsiporphyromonas endometrii]|uniref:Bifunctional oligoribonuclease/PAP phosphatase NrnA n=1 Tax=Falsiporphyromonas endometrii TaxID=1387297 RepID=A0ABV9K6P1_9PORP